MIMLKDIVPRLKHLAWFLPGFLLWAAFPPMGEGTDVLFALAPLMWLSRQGTVRASVWRWTQNGIFFWIATLSWMPAIVKNGGPWPLVALGWCALAVYCAAYFSLYGWLSASFWGWQRAREGVAARVVLRLAGVLLVEPILWCGLELIRSRVFGGFAWNQLGVVPANVGFGLPAVLGGVYLLSAVVILINGTFAGIAERIVGSLRRQPIERWRVAETVLAFVLVMGIYSAARSDRAARTADETATTVGVGMVQRNFPCCFLEREESPVRVYSNLLSKVAMLKPDLVVMPESALAEFGQIGGARSRSFAVWASQLAGNAAVLCGGGRTDSDGRLFNSAALYTSQDLSAPNAFGDPEVYDKVHLVPFGEFIPGDKFFPILQKLAPVGSCTPGEPKLLTLELGGDSKVSPEPRSIPLGVAICFEDTDSALMRRYAEMGAKMLVFITNDSWFSHSNESVQHAWQARLRAIETGLPVVRVGNSGVTGTVTPDGRASWLLDVQGRPLVDRRGTMFDRISIAAGETVFPTPYVRFGDWPLAIVFALLILAMLLVFWYHTDK